MTTFDFSQVDVFAPEPTTGNPVAVVHAADELTDEQMAAFARWTNLSETTFLVEPADPAADYRLRIFTPGGELPFAGHPTLGSAHAWLERGGTPRVAGEVVQECGIGLVTLRCEGGAWAFRAPDLLRSGPVEAPTLQRVIASLGVDDAQVVESSWIDNGPGWMGIRLRGADDVLALRPDFAAMGDLAVGVIGAHDSGAPADFEVRAFVPGLSVPEDPVTGSLNAGFAVWLIGAGSAPGTYTVRQGTALGRRGEVRVDSSDDGIWIGGTTRTLISGSLHL